jgi:hypothetical protein
MTTRALDSGNKVGKILKLTTTHKAMTFEEARGSEKLIHA